MKDSKEQTNMNVQKIDIKSEWIETRDGSPALHYAKRGPLEAVLLNDGEVPPQFATATEETYLIHEVKRKSDDRVYRYAIKPDERGLFQDLMAVSDELVNKLVTDRTHYLQRQFMQNLEAELWDQKRHIRSLPWYKRLFKKF